METRFFQKDIETMKRADIEALQLERLRWMVDYCYNNVPFYHERLGAAGITAGRRSRPCRTSSTSPSPPRTTSGTTTPSACWLCP